MLRDDAVDTVRGIGIIALSYVVMTLGDVAGKWALPAAGVSLLMVGRGVVGGAVMAVMAARAGQAKRLRPVRWRMVALRCTLHAFVSLTWYIAWESIPLADSYAIGFTAPLLMTLLAVPLLGERMRWRRVASTLVGFAGVLVMVRPGGALWTPAVALLLSGIVFLAVSRIMTRMLSTTETPECLAFWLLVAHIPAGLVLLPLFPVPALADPGAPGLSWDVWAAIAAMGLTNALAHRGQGRAFALAPVSALAPYEYTMLIWGGLLGYLVFREVPSASTLAGAAVVACAGLYNLHRERVRRLADA